MRKSYTFNFLFLFFLLLSFAFTLSACNSSKVNSFTITFKNEDGTVLESQTVKEGTLPSYLGATPEKASTEKYTYTFSGWDKEIVIAKENTEYTAVFNKEKILYTIIFKNEDGTILETQSLEYGITPNYSGTIPVKTSTSEYHYTFVGWNKEISSVKENTEYTAVFKEEKETYTVTFKNEDGTILDTQIVEYGSIPSYTGTPTMESTPEFSYTFIRWNKEMSIVENDQEYIALYEASKNSYTVTFKNEDGTILDTQIVEYGKSAIYSGKDPFKENTDDYEYTFTGWDKDFSFISTSIEVTAIYTTKQLFTIIHYDINGGYTNYPFFDKKIYNEVSKDDLFFDLTKENYNFRGWAYKDQIIFDAQGNQMSSIPEGNTLTFVAIFSQTSLVIIDSLLVDTGDYGTFGEIEGFGEYGFNTEITLLTNVSPGYEFIGWYTSNDELISNNSNYLYTVPKEDTKIIAKFTKKSYTLSLDSYNTQFGKVIIRNEAPNYQDTCEASFKYLTKVTISTITTSSEISFLGWYDENDNLISTKNVYTFYMPSSNYKLQAKWDKFLIHYDLDGGTLADSDVREFSSVNLPLTLPQAHKEGFYFLGWLDENGNYIYDIANEMDYSLQASFTDDLSYLDFTLLLNDTYSVIGTNPNVTEIIIPRYYSNKPVTVIGENAFKDYTSLSSIIIPKSITTIEDFAFKNCSSLTSIHLPSSILKIGRESLSDCTKLTEIYYNGNLSDWISIEFSEYEYCNNPISLFLNNVLLEKITIPETLTTIGNCVFSNLNISTSIVIPNSVISIGNYAFYNCTNLEEIVLPNELDVIGNGAFKNCTSLTSIAINAGLIRIGDNAFENCTNLEEIVTSNELNSIGNGAFKNCTSLTSIAINEGLVSIGANAFENCTNLTTINIPSTVTQIGEYIFSNCKNLTSSITLSNDITSIGNYAFYKCEKIPSINFPSNLTTIGNMAFCCCKNLEFESIPSTVTYIGYNAFYECYKLTSVVIPEGITKIEKATFRYCENLVSITIPETVEAIAGFAFDNCKSLTTITLPESITTIEENTFYNCSSLNSLFLPIGVTKIGDFAFAGCKSLTYINPSENVTSIGDYAFYNCQGLKMIVVPKNTTYLGKYVFASCTSLELAYIYANITDIQMYSFYGCTKLNEVFLLNDSITRIDRMAFGYCSNLTSIDFSGNVKKWQSISKHESWNTSTDIKEIICYDDTIIL